ncbi:MAG: M1 family aminopeptidase [Ginsengibacter sp.]
MMKFSLILFYFLSASYGFALTKVYEKNFSNFPSEEKPKTVANKAKETVASNDFDMKYFRCEWETDPAVRYIKGKVTSYFVMLKTSGSISFDLADALHVDSITNNQQSLSFTQDNNHLLINFNQQKASGNFDSVSIYYQGVPPNGGFGSFVNSLHAGIPVMWTLSEPYGSQDWWPCKNGLDDKADSIDVYITAPAQYSAVSNGLRQSITVSGANATTYWKHRYPIASYLICMAVTNYSEFKNYVQIGSTDLLMQTFCYPESLGLFQQQTPLVLASMQYFSSLFGPYPFIKEKYGHVQFGWGGGQEHQTSTFLIRPDEALMSHELAHQWFGDKVTCASWQHIWLNEGFATHLASMDWEKKYPLTVLATRKSEINSITSLPGGSVFVYDTTLVNRIFNSRLTYTKGSHVLYMLRWILGDSVFIKGANEYLNDSSLRYGFATTSDLQRNLQKVSGQKLDSFFKNWIYGEGYPSYSVKWSQIGNDYVRIKMDEITSHPSVSFFALPVALQFKNASQEKTIIVDNKFNGEIFLKNIGFVADTVIIDPEYWLITRNNTSQKIVDNNAGKNRVQVFPTPFMNKLFVYLQNFNQASGSIKMYDASGRLVYKDALNIQGSMIKEINSEKLIKGIYFIKIETSDGFKISRKVVK